MKNIIKIALICLMAVSGLIGQQLIDGIAIVVGREIILRSDIDQFVRNYVMQNRLDPQKNPAQIKKVRDDAIQSMIEQKLMLEQAEKDTVKVDDELVDQNLDQRIKYMIQQAGGEKKLEQAFQNPMKKIRKDMRKTLKEQLIVQKLRQQKFSDIKVSRRDVLKFYKQYQDSFPPLKARVDISHILKIVKPSPESLQKAYKQAEEIKKQLDAGADFAEMARKYSQDPASKVNGGDLGFTKRGDFVSEYEKVAFALKDGEISPITQSQFGFHIIQVLEHRGEKIHTRHILIRVTPSAADEQLTYDELVKIRNEALADSVDFGTLALKYSDDTHVKEDKGHLGEFDADKMVIPEFTQVIAILKPGEISMPFKTQYGYHIVKLNSRSDARQVSLEKDWQKLEEMARNFKTEKVYKKWIKKLKTEIPIEIRSSASQG